MEPKEKPSTTEQAVTEKQTSARFTNVLTGKKKLTYAAIILIIVLFAVVFFVFSREEPEQTTDEPSRASLATAEEVDIVEEIIIDNTDREVKIDILNEGFNPTHVIAVNEKIGEPLEITFVWNNQTSIACNLVVESLENDFSTEESISAEESFEQLLLLREDLVFECSGDDNKSGGYIRVVTS